MKNLKKYEDQFLIEVTPRIVIGFIRLCKASARMNMRTKVNSSDIDDVKKIISDSLFIRKK